MGCSRGCLGPHATVMRAPARERRGWLEAPRMCRSGRTGMLQRTPRLGNMSEALLLVDDDAPIRRMLARTLAAEGYEVEAVADGGAALAAVERNVPDAIVLDVTMPGVDGLAVTRRLRAKGLRVPILLLTARDALRDRVDGLDAGADDYLVKPFEVEELSARVRALLRRNEPPGETLAFADVVLEGAIARRAGRDLELTR